MQKRSRLAGSLIAALLLTPAFGQEGIPRDPSPAGQPSFPDSSIPALFASGSMSSEFARESKDPAWSSPTESLIRAEIEKARLPALRRAEVECRTSVCAILYVFSDTSNQARQRIDSITSALRGKAGFNTAELSMSDVPIPGAGGYAEVVLHSTRTIEVRQ